MEPKNWTPRRRIEDNYRRLIIRLIDKYLSLPDAATLGQITESLVNFKNLASLFEESAMIATRMAAAVKVENARSWREAARLGSRGRVIYNALQHEMEGNVGARVHEIVNENAHLISSIPEKLQEMVNREIASMEQQGVRHESIAAYLRRRVPELTRSRAALIARTETSKSATALTRARSEDLGINWYEWATSEDARVRPAHKIMDKVLVNWNDPPSPEALIGEKSTLGRYHAGNCPNCFTGESEVNLSNGCDKLWRRWYIGPIVNLRLANGTVMEATPNHPVLTKSGWLPVDALQEGDYLVKAKIGNLCASETHHDRLVKFSDLFKSLKLQVGSESSPGSYLDFHGDGTENQVDVINADGFLLDASMLSTFERLTQFVFAGAEMDAMRFARDRSCGFGFDGIDRIASSLMSRFSQILSLIFGESCKSDGARFASCSEMNFGRFQGSPDSASVTSEYFAERQFALSGLIHPRNFSDIEISRNWSRQVSLEGKPESAERIGQSIPFAWDDLCSGGNRHPFFDSLVKVEGKVKRDFEGHVYNLQTKDGWYCTTPSNIMVHNCRCDSYPILRLENLKWPRKVYWQGKIRMVTLSRFKLLAA